MDENDEEYFQGDRNWEGDIVQSFGTSSTSAMPWLVWIRSVALATLIGIPLITIIIGLTLLDRFFGHDKSTVRRL